MRTLCLFLWCFHACSRTGDSGGYMLCPLSTPPDPSQNLGGPSTEGRQTESGEESHIPVSLSKTIWWLSFPYQKKSIFFCRQKLEEWENPCFEFQDKCRILSHFQYESHLDGTQVQVLEHLTFSAAFHYSCRILGDPSHHTLDSLNVLIFLFVARLYLSV